MNTLLVNARLRARGRPRQHLIVSFGARQWGQSSERREPALDQSQRLLHMTTAALSQMTHQRPPVLPNSHQGQARKQPEVQLEGASAYAPTAADLIRNTQQFLPRMRLRARLLLLGTNHYRRQWRVDDLLAFFSWGIVGTLGLVLAGTTTAVSVLVALGNSIAFQEYIAEQISDSLTEQTGFEIKFESAIVPRWREGSLRLKNVSIVCTGDTWLRRLEQNHDKKRSRSGAPSKTKFDPSDVDLNWTYWDLTVDAVDVQLSLWRWLEGKGILSECRMKGVRGTVDRRHVTWDPNWVPTRRSPQPGDFVMDSFVVDDLLLDILNPGFRPYKISVFHGELPLFRKQWLLYDIMCANSIVGMFDNCLFSVHKPQEDEIMGLRERRASSHGDADKVEWAKLRHLKINGFPIDHLNTGVEGPFGWITRGNLDVDFHLFIPQHTADDDLLELLRAELGHLYALQDLLLKNGAIGSGEVVDNVDRAAIVEATKLGGVAHTGPSILTGAASAAAAAAKKPRYYPPRFEVSESVSSNANNSTIDKTNNAHSASTLSSSSSSKRSSLSSNIPQPKPSPSSIPLPTPKSDGSPVILMHGFVTLKDLRASVPLSSPHISYMNSALIRPVVAYMNANRIRIPLSFWAKMDLGNFDGAWTFHSAGLVDLIAEEVGRALADTVLSERERTHQLKRMGIWSLQNMSKSIVTTVEYLRGEKGWANWTMHFGSPFYQSI